MGTVIDMAEYRERRGWKALQQAVLSGEWQPMTPAQIEEADLIRDAIRNPPQWPAPTVSSFSQRMGLEGYEPSYTVYDETHLWTATDLAPFYAAIDATVEQLALQEGIPSELLRNIPRTDHGSDDGDAESHRGDAEEPH